MRLLVVSSMYPHPGLPYSGIFNRNCVEALVELGHQVVVFVPRPYLPPLLAVHPRWAAYAKIPGYCLDGGVEVYRPRLLQIPRFGATFQRNRGAYWQVRGHARRLQQKHRFDAVFSFEMSAAGGLAWRLGSYLGIPATGWAFGDDVRVASHSADARELRTTLERLCLVYYQSSELRRCAAALVPDRQLDPQKHVVLPHGIPALVPPPTETRKEMRAQLGIAEDTFLVLFLGRVVAGKGIDELVASFAIAAAGHPQLRYLIVGETPGFDESRSLRQRIDELGLGDRIHLLPACPPQQVPRYHAAADLFAFPSKREGMPNALLEAMALGTPSVAFDIPPIVDILAHGECLAVVTSFNATQFGETIARLIDSPHHRRQLAETAQAVVRSHYDIAQNMAQAIAHLQPLILQGGNRRES